MPYPARHISTVQRDRLLRRAGRLRAWCESNRKSRPAFALPARRYRRYKNVAARLERYVAGVNRRDSTLPLIEAATRRHIAGLTSYAEWIDELRWAGLPARTGHTRLNRDQAAERRENLAGLYPRLNKKS